MLPINKLTQRFTICSLMLFLGHMTIQAQTTQPTWWFGVSGAANFNFYDGTTQRLNNTLIAPTAFHDGFGIRPYGSFLIEYRPASALGVMLNVGYDGRGGKFDDVIAPCNCPATLETNTSYITVEPSLRLRVASSNFYLFAGPRVAFNLNKDFSYTQLRQPDTDSELSEMRKTVVSGQIGAGYDFDISSPNSRTKINLSPFVSFHPYFGQDARDIESWSITSVRTGIALKFGRGEKDAIADAPVAVPVTDVIFTVREPKEISLNHQISETLPLRNSVFFNPGSSEIPSRYVLLSADQAGNFKEEQLLNEQSANTNGRSARQLNVYHNILNILGDRMRANPTTSITLVGASAKGKKEGRAFAESIKEYMVTSFGIDGSRITTNGRTEPVIPSKQPDGTRELALLREEDRRVDIQSTSAELLMEVGGGMMKPIQINASQVDPLDSHVILNVKGAEKQLKSWSVALTDANGIVQNYGPFTKDQASIPGKTILNNSQEGTYQIAMNGETKDGLPVKKESSLHLISQKETIEKSFRYSILFDFNKSNTVASYEKFLTDVVSPLITSGSTVIIHGHTDVIGDVTYNTTLSQSRSEQTQNSIERVLSGSGVTNVKFETSGFGEDLDHAPFENNLPEERFYNRTVVIDIIPAI
ncbi:outer membrane beta-barrel protein [Arcticibacter eurypsychrophilus]|uniref:outer membrane beta-barrel protein n=1 Tax=Arcticibacter eurypsychrophilus TaxID=1434752 RepID=UPI00084D9398|nr:outer membrane beta-barrel protein [Arcticibacter eurypsychrophilus]